MTASGAAHEGPSATAGPPRRADASTWVHRAVVTAFTLGIAWRVTQVAPAFGAVPHDLGRWFEATWMNLGFAACANLLAQVVVWRVGHRADGRNLGVFLGSFSVCLALSVVPGGAAGPWQGGLFAAFWTATILLSWRFWASFPRPMEVGVLEDLARRLPRRGWFAAPNRLVVATTQAVLARRGVWLLFALVAAAFGFEMVNPDAYTDNMLMRPPDALPVPRALTATAAAVVSIFVSVGFAWTSYLLADPEGRRRVLWVVLAQLVIGIWTALGSAFYLLSGVSSSAPVLFGDWLFRRTHIPLTLTVNLTGFAVAIFYSGALDLRPIINRTTIYGAAVIVLGVLFAGVEELLQSQLAHRLGIPDGAATWAGAVAVALAVGPIHARLERIVRRVATELERSEQG